MKLSVAPELKQPGKTGEYHASVEYGPLDYLGRSVEFAKPLELALKYSFDGEGFDVAGALATRLKSRCARCNREFEEPFDVELNERFVKNPGDEDGCYGYSGDVLDLSQMVLENILLNLPMYSVCRQDCKGLCPVCGCDLNLTQCSCNTAGADNPFAVLTDLFTDDKEV